MPSEFWRELRTTFRDLKATGPELVRSLKVLKTIGPELVTSLKVLKTVGPVLITSLKDFKTTGPELFKSLKDLKQLGPDLKDSLAESLAQLVPPTEDGIKRYPEISLEQEYQRQVDQFIKLGFHKELNLTEEEYRKSLPRFDPQPKEFKGRFDNPVLVETRIEIKRLCELVGMKYNKCIDILYYPGRRNLDINFSQQHQNPYTVWMDDGRHNLNKKIKSVIKRLKVDQRSATDIEGIALYISNKGILLHHYLALPGTLVGPDHLNKNLENMFPSSPKYLHIEPEPGTKVPELTNSYDQGLLFGVVTCGREK